MRSTYDLRPDRGIDWLTRAACREYDPNWWSFPNPNNHRARAICGGCPVKAQCRERAERLGSQGVIIAGKALRVRGEYAGTGRINRLCTRCRKPFWATNARQVFCRNACRVAVHNRQRAAAKRMGAP